MSGSLPKDSRLRFTVTGYEHGPNTWCDEEGDHTYVFPPTRRDPDSLAAFDRPADRVGQSNPVCVVHTSDERRPVVDEIPFRHTDTVAASP